jgi:hypothetical protein
MFCWSCGSPMNRTDGSCRHCGVRVARVSPQAPSLPRESESLHALRVCMGCGYRGEGVPYFRRAAHAALLAGATILTYGIGGLAYWLIKRRDRVCPSCGISWKRSRALGTAALPAPGSGLVPEGRGEAGARSRRSGEEWPSLPSAGVGRRVFGVLLALLAVLLVGVGIVEAEGAFLAVSLAFGLAGAASFAWGWKARQIRREALLRRLQGRVLHLARARGGTLTATDVASAMDLSLDGAERVLLSLDDGFRIRSDVTDDGLLVFEFPEIRLGSRRTPESPSTPRSAEDGGSSGEEARLGPSV